MKKLIALGLGAVFTLVIFEIALRLIGFQELYSRDALGPGVKSEMPAIIFVGNSHTMGTGAAPGKSFPDQFREILNVRHGKSPFEIVNLGRGNANSSFVADQMPKFLKTYRPQIVVLMTGETNFWNHLGYSDFVQKTSPGLESIGLKFLQHGLLASDLSLHSTLQRVCDAPEAGSSIFLRLYRRGSRMDLGGINEQCKHVRFVEDDTC